MTARNTTVPFENMTGKEQGLIKHLSCRNTQLKWKCDELDTAHQVACGMLYQMGGADKVFEYYEGCEFWAQAYLMTTIGDYTSKKTGKISKAHFSQNGCYIGSVYKMGDSPVKMLQNTKVYVKDKHLWKVDTGCPHILHPIK